MATRALNRAAGMALMVVGLLVLVGSLASGFSGGSSTTTQTATTFTTVTQTKVVSSSTPNIVVPVSCSVNSVSGTVGTSFTFSASAQVTAPVFTWNFGDGAAGSGPTVTHAYASAGTWTATVDMQNAAGYSGSGACTVTVTQSSTGGGTYGTLAITVVASSGNGAVTGATVTLSASPQMIQTTNSGGQAIFTVPTGTYQFGVTAAGFQTYSGTVTLTSSGNQLTVFLATTCTGRICPQSGLGIGSAGAANSDGAIVGFVLFAAGLAVFRRRRE